MATKEKASKSPEKSSAKPIKAPVTLKTESTRKPVKATVEKKPAARPGAKTAKPVAPAPKPKGIAKTVPHPATAAKTAPAKTAVRNTAAKPPQAKSKPKSPAKSIPANKPQAPVKKSPVSSKQPPAPTKKAPAPAAPQVAPKKPVQQAKPAPVAPQSAPKKPVQQAKPAPVAPQPAAKKPVQQAKPAPVAPQPAPKKPVQQAKPAPAAKPAAPLPAPVTPSNATKAPVGIPPAISPIVRPGGVSASARTLPPSKAKILPREFLIELAQCIKEAVAPHAKAVRGREIVSTATSGDATFEIDRFAEKALLNFLKTARAPVAYYSEDAGYSTFSSVQPANLLVVDPIDGTRAAKSGFEGCVVAIASTRVIERPRMADVDNACVLDIMNDRLFYAERGKGVRMYVDGVLRRPRLSQNTNLEMLTWSMTVPARPAELIFPTAARLIDLSSLKGGFFACNSTSFSLTRLLTTQLDACLDFAGRYMREIPDVVRDYFINAGRGTVLGIAPYDLAASLLIAQEAGCTVTDGFGMPFDDVLLLDSTSANHQSLVAASNKELHGKLMNFLNARIPQYEKILERRAQLAQKK